MHTPSKPSYRPICSYVAAGQKPCEGGHRCAFPICDTTVLACRRCGAFGDDLRPDPAGYYCDATTYEGRDYLCLKCRSPLPPRCEHCGSPLPNAAPSSHGELERLETESRAAVQLATLMTTLMGHWLYQVECDHEAKTDRAHCSCGRWSSEPQPSVGKAVEAWAVHVASIVLAAPSSHGP